MKVEKDNVLHCFVLIFFLVFVLVRLGAFIIFAPNELLRAILVIRLFKIVPSHEYMGSGVQDTPSVLSTYVPPRIMQESTIHCLSRRCAAR